MMIVIGAIMCILLAICLIVCRLFLQWSIPLWKKESMLNEKQIYSRKKFWKYYINVECIAACGAGLALIPLISAFLPELTSSETLFNWYDSRYFESLQEICKKTMPADSRPVVKLSKDA